MEHQPQGAGVAEPKSITVILPVRNRAQLIEACLIRIGEVATSVLEKGIALDVIVANDASTDATGEVVERIAQGSPMSIRQVHLATRQGPARARNAALEHATGDLVLFVDSDVLITPGFFEAHLKAHKEAPGRVFGVGTLISVPSLEVAQEAPEPTVWDRSGATLDTANASARLEDLKAIGFFDPGFEGMGWQDLDLGKRLLKAGVDRVQVKEAVAYHIQPPIETYEQLKARLQKESERGTSALRYMEKHPGLSTRLSGQDTVVHSALNWVFRMGGLVNENNVLDWVAWARKRRLVALEKMWLAGVINQSHLRSLRKAKQARRKAGR